MAYQALYRVWRSQRFEDIVGQQTITQTLKNAIVQKKTSHAYLFTGPRGTGKTSAAKIFAKAINCRHSSDGEPCNKCDTCLAITEGRLNDVLEIDAASNNGVEEIRDIRDKVKYAPTQADYKVYIIDEVHMLSTGAFNALLKTLEEPPKNVLFILATTEPHKIPLTIISRTQRFDFKRIRTKDIVVHMNHILNELNISIEEQALYVIARAAEGGMRDALSILDQAISFSEGKVTTEDALQVTGSLTYDMMDKYLQACIVGEVEKALENLEYILDSGKEAHRFLEDLLLYCRDLLMFQQAPSLLSEKVGEVTLIFQEIAKQTSVEKICQMINVLNETQQDIRFTNNSAIYLEVATVKLSRLIDVQKDLESVSLDDEEIRLLKHQVDQMQQEIDLLKKGPSNATPKASPIEERPVKMMQTFKIPTEQVYKVLNEATKENLNNIKNIWEDLLQMLSVTQRAMLNASEPVAASSMGIVVAFDYEIICSRVMEDKLLQLAVQNNLSRFIEGAPEMICIPKENWPKIRQSFIHQNKEILKENKDKEIGNLEEIKENSIKENSLVNEAFAMFGKELVEIIND